MQRKHVARYSIAVRLITLAGMDTDDSPDRMRWTDTARARLPYAIGFLGLLAWFALLYFMLRDAL